MQTLRNAASTPQSESRSQNVRYRPAPEDMVYRIVTLGAVLLVLGSLWVF